MSIRALACILLLAAASAQAAAPAKKKAPPEAPPQELDLDAMARAKDVDAQKTPPQDAAAETSTAEPADAAASETANAEPAAAAANAEAEKTESQDAQSRPESASAASKPSENAAQDAVALTPPIDAKEKRLASACLSRSTTLLDAAQKGDFATATKDFDAKMRSALPQAKFKETWSSLAQFGVLQARGEAHPAKGEGYFIVMTPLIFEKSTLVAQVACGSDGRVAGFYVKPLSAVQQ